MIHDATVEVTCDNPDCQVCTFVALRAGARDTYLASDGDIEKSLAHEGWVCRDGMQFCSQDCVDEYDEVGE